MFKNLLGDPNARKLKRYFPLVSDINIFEEDLLSLSDDDLRTRTCEFRSKLEKASSSNEELSLLDELLPEAFAVVREAGKRVLGCLLYTSPSPRDRTRSRMPSSA